MQNSQYTKPIAICLMGPTACGKTDLSIALSQYLPIEIINVDSAQIYQGMDIGSGKPNRKIREQVPHHLMDFLDPKIPYSVAQFREDAIACILEMNKREKIPLLVGGTMLYFKVLQHGLSHLPDAHPLVREKLEKIAKEQGLSAIYQQLQQLDPITSKRLHPTDFQRILRAMEIFEVTGQPMSYWLSQPNVTLKLPCEFVNIGLIPIGTPREILHQRIQDRFDDMLQQGFIAEVEQLRQREDLDLSKPALRAVGYRQIWQYLGGDSTFDEMRDKSIAASRQLAKRQLTWLRSWPGLTTFDFLCPQLLNQVLHFLRSKGI